MSGAFKPVTFLILVFATVVVLAEDYDVGDDTQWKRPTDLEFYTTWAAGKTFHVGDELEFEFDHERHDVAIVTQDAYENCIKDKPIKVITTSPAKIKLTTTGPQYFICSMADHCRWGQKLEINVVGAGGAATPAKGGAAGGATPGPSAGGGSTPAPGAGPSAGGGATEAPGAGPSAGGSIPPTTPSETTPSGSGETTKPSGSGETSTTTKPPAESAASSLGGATFLAAFVSAVIALF